MSEKELKNKKIYISGMTCVSCEMIISDELNSVDGVIEVKVCHKNKLADITHDNRAEFEQIKNTIEKLGYKASLEPILNERKQKSTVKQWFYSLLIFVLLIVGYKMLKALGLLNWVSVSTNNYSYGVALLLGLIASLSSCLAVVGGVVLSFAAKYKTQGGFYQSNIKPHLLFHLGRLVSFFVLGGLLGILGGWFNLSNSFIGWFTAIVAIVMVLLGLNIIGLTPNISKLGIRLPGSTSKTWNRLKQSEHKLAPLLLGAFTFFLPCGFTQSMQLFAISTGSFWQGAATMALFSLGTLPVLGIIGITASRFKNKKTVILQKVIGFVIILFAFYTLMSGLALAGLNVDFALNKKYGSTIKQGNEQIVNMTVDYSGYSPNVFTIKKNVPVKWIINVKQMTGCTNEIIIPSLGISKKLQIGENIVQFTAKNEGDLSFSCWMGMVRGKFIVSNGNDLSQNSLNTVNTVNNNQNTIVQSQCGGGDACGGGCGGGCGSTGCQINK